MMRLFACGLALLLLVHGSVRAGWVIVCDDNPVVSQDVPEELSAKFKELEGRHAKIKSVAFTRSGGWVVLFDKSGQASARIPKGASEQLEQLSAANAEIQCAAFMPWYEDGWAIVHDRNQIAWAKFPEPYRD